jgi:uncharacterized Zn finger protein
MSGLFDEDAIREGMPEARVMRGDMYFEKGWVDLLAVGEGGTVAHVTGETGAVYVVRLFDRRGADAQCGCPDARENGRCKHIVAVARAANSLDAAAAREVAQRLPRLVDQLIMEGRDDAVEAVEAAKDDPALLRSLEGLH